METYINKFHFKHFFFKKPPDVKLDRRDFGLNRWTLTNLSKIWSSKWHSGRQFYWNIAIADYNYGKSLTLIVRNQKQGTTTVAPKTF